MAVALQVDRGGRVGWMKSFVLAILAISIFLGKAECCGAERTTDITVKEFIAGAALLSLENDLGRSGVTGDQMREAEIFSAYFHGVWRTIAYGMGDSIDLMKGGDTKTPMVRIVAERLRQYEWLQDLPATPCVINVFLSEWGRTPEIVERGNKFLGGAAYTIEAEKRKRAMNER